MLGFKFDGAPALALTLVLASCANHPPRPQDLINSALVVNSVKCGFALALAKDRELALETGYSRLLGNVATFQLQMKVASTTTASGSVSGIIPFQGVSLLPSFSHSNSQAWTVDTVINASYQLDAENTAVCAAAETPLNDKGEPADPFGFTQWLSNILVDLSKVSLEKPTGKLEKLTYDATFGLTKSTEGNVGLKLAFLDANTGGKIDRVDTQHIIIVISAAPSAPTKPNKPNDPIPPNQGGGLGPFKAEDIPKLSTIQPSEE